MRPKTPAEDFARAFAALPPGALYEQASQATPPPSDFRAVVYAVRAGVDFEPVAGVAWGKAGWDTVRTKGADPAAYRAFVARLTSSGAAGPLLDALVEDGSQMHVTTKPATHHVPTAREAAAAAVLAAGLELEDDGAAR